MSEMEAETQRVCNMKNSELSRSPIYEKPPDLSVKRDLTAYMITFWRGDVNIVIYTI